MPSKLPDLPKYVPNPLLDALPEHLKDPENYEKIQIALLETLATLHSHGDMLEWGECADCMGKLRDHRNMMLQLGFKTPQHYQAWQKNHEEMKRVMKLVDKHLGKL